MLYELNDVFKRLIDRNAFKATLMQRQQFNLPPGVIDATQFFSNKNSRDMTITVTVEAPDKIEGVRTAKTLVITLFRVPKNYQIHLQGVGDLPPAHTNFNEDRLFVRGTPVLHCQALFEACKYLSSTTFIGPFRNAINIGGSESYYDIQIGQTFVNNWQAWKTSESRHERSNIVDLQRDIRELFGYASLEIQASTGARGLQAVINDKPYDLVEVGSGLSQFILVLANAKRRNSEFIMIDEPELNLHPSLQLTFLTTLASYAKIGLVYGTHSIGLARANADRVYALRRIEEGISEIRNYDEMPILAEFLGELNFGGYRELGFDQILLVEGPTDVRTIHQFLQKLGAGKKFVLLPLSGASLINAKVEHHLEEVRRITPHVAAIIDSERDTPEAVLSPDRQAFVTACQNAGVPCRVLDRPAIENYLTESAIRKVKSDKYRALGPYERLKAINPAWSKEENWKIAREMDFADIADTDLGNFLRTLVS